MSSWTVGKVRQTPVRGKNKNRPFANSAFIENRKRVANRKRGGTTHSQLPLKGGRSIWLKGGSQRKLRREAKREPLGKACPEDVHGPNVGKEKAYFDGERRMHPIKVLEDRADASLSSAPGLGRPQKAPPNLVKRTQHTVERRSGICGGRTLKTRKGGNPHHETWDQNGGFRSRKRHGGGRENAGEREERPEQENHMGPLRRMNYQSGAGEGRRRCG